MTIPAVSGPEGLPHVDRTALPADVRKASKEDQKLYKTALGFERMLLGQLTKVLVDSALPSGDDASPAVSAYKDMLPDAMTEALMSGGGIGLAAALQEEGA